jgi:4-hydroxy 2-oxovalerate aldolase
MGYHGHNNFQLAFSNTIKFMEFDTKRHRIVDSTVYGMGKSAGNCASELLSLYLNNNYEKKYDVSQYLEILDTDLMPIYKRRYWGYAYNYYISAMENCHPNYVQYLLDKRSLTVSSVNEILEVIPDEKKLHYDAKLIENIYIKFQSRMDTETCNDEELKELLKSKEIILLGPGSSIKTYGDYISMIKKDKDAVMIATNFMPEGLECEYVFVSNAKRYSRLVDSLNGKIMNYKLITTSNVNCFDVQPDYMINYHSLINPSHMIIDNALILCISMLVRMGIKRVSLAGFDGFANMNRDYFDVSYSFCYTDDNIKDINEMTVQGLKEMCKIIDIEFLTPSIYQEHMVNGQEVEV